MLDYGMFDNVVFRICCEMLVILLVWSSGLVFYYEVYG